MDLLKKEVERKKKAVALAKQNSELQVAGTNSRTFLKAAELRRMQDEEEERQRKRKPTVTKTDAGDTPKKRKQDVDERTTTSLLADQNRPLDDMRTAAQPAISVQHLSSADVMKRLRSFGLPVRLFGESNAKRIDRLREALERQEHAADGQSEMNEFRLGSGHGIRNPFLERRTGSEDLSGSVEAAAAAPTSAKGVSSREALGGNEQTAELSKENGTTEQDRQESNLDDPHKKIYRFFKDLLNQWEEDVMNRPEEFKRTAAGKNETKTVKQCKDYIRPLFKLCKSRRLEPSLMSHILKIVDFCEAGEFVQAHDAYLDVAIGRAAWPIGVTMVGIHARTGRSKIESANVAHVMNSELQRKYLTSVKRLMSYCQKKREDVAPSKKVIN